jgi:hypothetical protein
MADCSGFLQPEHPPVSHHTKVTTLSDFPDFTTWLKAQPEFETKKRLLILTDIYHTPSGEKVQEGFRYLNVSGEELLAAFDSGDFEAIAALPHLFDDEGEPDTGSVCVSVGYTKGGAFLVLQPQIYKDYAPSYPREPKYFTPKGDLVAAALELDQSA